MFQETEKVTDKIQEVVQEDIWGAIKSFLELGFHYGKGDKEIHITIGLLLVVTISFFVASFLLKTIRKLFTRKMEEVDKLKFISVFKFIKYITYVIVVFASLSFSGNEAQSPPHGRPPLRADRPVRMP